MSGFLAWMGVVDVVEGEVEEERFVFVGLDEFEGFGGESIAEVLAFLAAFVESGHLDAVVATFLATSVGPEVAAGRAGAVAGDVDVESLFFGEVGGVAQVPLADEEGGVVGLFERFGKCDLFERKLHAHGGGEVFSGECRPGDVGRDLQSCGVAASEECGAGGVSNSCGRRSRW